MYVAHVGVREKVPGTKLPVGPLTLKFGKATRPFLIIDM